MDILISLTSPARALSGGQPGRGPGRRRGRDDAGGSGGTGGSGGKSDAR